MIKNKKAIVITGGPGMGKTSIIDCLKSIGYPVVQESGRQIIQQQIANGGSKLPWMDRSSFASEMFNKAVDDFEAILENSGYTFLDRGLPDTIGYLLLCELPVPEEMWIAAKKLRYYDIVFITPPWKEIYSNDGERKQSFQEATATYDVMYDLYIELDYKVIVLPKINIADRVKYILAQLDK